MVFWHISRSILAQKYADFVLFRVVDTTVMIGVKVDEWN